MEKESLKARRVSFAGRQFILVAAIWLGSSTLQTASAQNSDCTYGPDTCKQGYVWREADDRDHACVRPEVRAQTRKENGLASSHRAGGGAYGPNTCKQGFVWREAFRGDVACVTPASRAQAAKDNQLVAQRRACRQSHRID
jgi:hypothetical protein